MKIVSRRSFQTSAHQLWQIVSDPGNMPAWNPKCTNSTRVQNAKQGDRFEATYSWNNRTHHVEGEILSCTPNEEIVFRLYYEAQAKLGSVDESFQIKQRDIQHATVIHTVDFSRSTLPFWVKVLIGFLGRFGRKMGKDSLEQIQDLIR